MAEFQEAPVGVTGVETAVGVILTKLYHDKVLSIQEIVSKISVRPAEILKLPNGFGQIKEGTEANLTIVNLNEEWTVKLEHFVSKSKNSCFIGNKLKGKPVAAICRGKLWRTQS